MDVNRRGQVTTSLGEEEGKKGTIRREGVEDVEGEGRGRRGELNSRVHLFRRSSHEAVAPSREQGKVWTLS